jgi:dTDP-4-amino-4,6-dideoxygalactose transaminase
MRPLLPRTASITPYLKRIDESRIYSNYGPLYDELSSRLAEYFGVRTSQVLILTNGTLALEGAVRTVDSSSSEWVIPSWTFVATGHAVLSAGGILRFGDVNESDWTLKYPELNNNQLAIYVAPFGLTPDLKGLAAHFTQTPVVVDAASCFDSCQNVGRALPENVMLMVSLHATKTVTTGEGGVLIGPEDWIRRIRTWSNFGFHGSRIAHNLATNSKISEYHAAVGLASLDNWEHDRKEWERTAYRMQTALTELGCKTQLAFQSGQISSTCIAIFESESHRNTAESKLEAHGIETRRWWGDGLHRMPSFAEIGATHSLQTTERIASTTLGIPYFRDLDSNAIDRIGSCIR